MAKPAACPSVPSTALWAVALAVFTTWRLSCVSMAQRIWKNVIKWNDLWCSLLSQRHIKPGSCAAPKRLSRHLQPSSTVKTNVSFVVLIKAFHLLPLGLWKGPSLHPQLCQGWQLCQCCQQLPEPRPTVSAGRRPKAQIQLREFLECS